MSKELRLKYSEGSPLDARIERLVEHFGIDKPALLQMAVRRLEAATFPAEVNVTTPFRADIKQIREFAHR